MSSGGVWTAAGRAVRPAAPLSPAVFTATSVRRRGGSKAGRTQKKRATGFQARRRAAIVFEYEKRGLTTLPSIPDLPKGRPKKDAPKHPAAEIAASLTVAGERAPDTSWVLQVLRQIHAEGIENYDPSVDGHANERPGMQKLTAADDALLFATRKMGSLEDRAATVTDSRAIEGKSAVDESTIRRREKRLHVVVSRTQETHMQTSDEEKRCAAGRLVCAQEWLDRIDAFNTDSDDEFYMPRPEDDESDESDDEELFRDAEGEWRRARAKHRRA
jgi:hypothetical protein